VRTVPGVDKANGTMEIGTLGKVLDRKEKFPLDMARRIDHTKVETVPAPSATADYGRFLIRMCTGCHGEGLSGGPLPGAPSDLAVPRNLTPDATGLNGWTFEDFDKTLTTGVSRDGTKLAALMPVESFGQLDPLEKKALYAYLMSVPPLPFGGR
jgi:mono/diheme cytochrome c family protein